MNKTEYMRVWREENRSHLRAYQKQYRIDHKEEIEANRKKYIQKHRERISVRDHNRRKNNPKNTAYIHAKSRAKREGILFTIQLSDIPDIPDLCPIAQIPIFIRDEPAIGSADNSPSLDKIDNDKGYVPGNVRIISSLANRWKSDMSKDDIERLFKYVKGEI